MSAIAALLRPRSVAVIGASADASKMTGRPVGYLQKYGFTGEIWPVNPRAGSIAGLRCYPDVASLPAAPDAAIVLLGPDRAEAAVRDLAARGCQAAIVLASGYGRVVPVWPATAVALAIILRSPAPWRLPLFGAATAGSLAAATSCRALCVE